MYLQILVLTLQHIGLPMRHVQTIKHTIFTIMEFLKKNFAIITVVAIAALMLLPFLGLTEFNTKGEPREAVVAMSMLNEGNWILPVNNGIDIPYKPPFFHYCIAILSELLGGINEYTSRLPSALALILLAVCSFVFYRRTSTVTALSGAILLLTSFEVHRAGVNCRVDMVLTVFTVGALYLFYRWWERGGYGVPLLAVLCMSGAVLTKGPVGFIVPCFVMGVFTLLRGGRFWRTFGSYAGFALLSCILPAIWYVAAWHEGGQHFLDLVYEENIGRMTGTMSYESHAHAFPYNFVTLAVGWLPWILLLAMSLLSRPWAKANAARANANKAAGLMQRLQRLRVRIMQIPPVRLFTWLGFLLVLFFYCLPSSKRSVYLLPCYPFMAMLIAQYVEWLWQTRRRGALRAYTVVVASLSLLLAAAFVAVRAGAVPDSLFHGKHAADNLAMLHALRYTPLNIWTVLLLALPVYNAIDVLRATLSRKTRNNRGMMYYCLLSPVVLLFFAIDGFYQPVVLNTKSLRPMAEYINRTFPGEPVYQYVETPMMHFFGADYYLGNRMDQFEETVGKDASGTMRLTSRTPERGVLVVPASDFGALAARHPGYRFTLVRTFSNRISEIKGDVSFYRFCRVR